jgi:hypothetical protein
MYSDLSSVAGPVAVPGDAGSLRLIWLPRWAASIPRARAVASWMLFIALSPIGGSGTREGASRGFPR